jgi:assimilatory nitrate reductase catalytic subunit
VELFAAIGRGEVKAVWIMGTNPVVSLPDSHAVSQALAGCPLVIVSRSPRQTDTGAFAHIRFPALAWGEKWHGHQLGAAYLPPAQLSAAAGEAKADWWIIAGGRRWASARPLPGSIRMSLQRACGAFRFENDGQRAFDIGGLADLSREAWDAWRRCAGRSAAAAAWISARLAWRWQTADGAGDASTDAGATDAFYPLILNSGRIRDQWHTMTRTGACRG